jgi:DNA-binding response OmpR family regulator
MCQFRGKKVRIGKKEGRILQHFVDNFGALLSRENSIHSVWSEHTNVRSRSMDQYIVNCSQKKDCPMHKLRPLQW